MLLHRARAIDSLRRCGVEAVIATSPTHVTYLSDYRSWLDGLMRRYMSCPGDTADLSLKYYAVLAADGGGSLIVPSMQQPEAQPSWMTDVQVYGAPELDSTQIPAQLPDHVRVWLNRMQVERAPSAVEALVAVLRDRKLDRARLGLECEGLPPGAREKLAAALPAATFLDCSNLLRLMRAVKSSEEISRLTQAAEIAEQAAQASLNLAVPGRRLADLMEAYRVGLAQRGADLDHLIFSVYGLGMGTAPDYELRAGDVLLVD